MILRTLLFSIFVVDFDYAFFCLRGEQFICGVGFMKKRIRQILVVFIKHGIFGLRKKRHRNYTVALDLIGKSFGERIIVSVFHFEGDIRSRLVLDAADAEFCGAGCKEFSERSERTGSEPRENAPGVASEMNDRVLKHSRISRKMSSDLKAVRGIFLEIGIDRIFFKHAAHSLQYLSVDLAVVAGPGDLHLALDRFDVDQLSRDVELLDLPHSARERKAVADGRRSCDRAYLLGFVADGEVLTILEYRIELEA